VDRSCHKRRYFSRPRSPIPKFQSPREQLTIVHYFVLVVLSNRHKNIYFLCRLLKTAGTKNKNIFLVTVEIISQYHKKILGVTINHFSSSVATFHNDIIGSIWVSPLSSSRLSRDTTHWAIRGYTILVKISKGMMEYCLTTTIIELRRFTECHISNMWPV
jgi:hypothetical protein